MLINDWLKNKGTYEDGVALYAEHPKHNRNLLKLFNKRKSAANTQKLKYELKKIVVVNTAAVINKTPVVVAPVVNPKATVAATIAVYEKKQALFFHELPEELQPVLLEANTLFKTNCLLKVQLNAVPDDQEEEALAIQKRIVSNTAKNTLCWKKIDFWKQHRILPKPDTHKVESLTPAQLVRREQLLFASISKLKKRLEVNTKKLTQATTTKERTKLERAITKQTNNILFKEEEKLKIQQLINGG